MTQNLTLQYDKQVYQLVAPPGTRAFRGAQVLVREDARGKITLDYQGRQLAYTLYQQQTRQANVVPSQQTDRRGCRGRPTQAGGHHPRRQSSLAPCPKPAIQAGWPPGPSGSAPARGRGLIRRGHFYFGEQGDISILD